MVVTPSSTIYLLKNVPLNNTYDHTIRFTSQSAQLNYFERPSLRVASFTEQSYQRYNKGKLRIKELADNILSCNYLMFQNTAHGIAKWYYAFVTSIDYINENVSELTYEIDVIQTYMFDISFGYCFVEREHTPSDGEEFWRVPENIETGEYMNIAENSLDFGTPRIAVRTLYDLHSTNHSFAFQGYDAKDNMYSGLGTMTFNLNYEGANQFDSLIEAREDYAQGIVSVDVVPHVCFAIEDGDYAEHFNITIERPTSIGTYIPKNKKVLSYPYCFICADNHMGNTAEFAFEDFTLSTAKFEAKGTSKPNYSVWTYPLNYKKLEKDYSSAIVSNGFPTCPYGFGTYDSWLAQNKNSMGLSQIASGVSILGGIVGIGASLLAPETAPITAKAGTAMLIGGATKIASIEAQKKDRQALPLQAKNRTNGDGMIANLNLFNVTFYTKSIKDAMAKVIDDYFSMYGYAVHRLKVPNLFTPGATKRPHWNYLKTINCELTTNNCPADDARLIKEIHDNGITYWEHADEIGNYGLDNSI